MLDLVTEASTLGALLEETRGVVGVVLGTAEGEIRAIVGSVEDSDTGAMAAAALTGELNKIGALLGIGPLGAASLKAATAARVFAEQSGAVVVIELDPKRPLVDLETKLRTVAWAPEEELLEAPAINRVPTVPNPLRAHAPTLPPPLPAQGLQPRTPARLTPSPGNIPAQITSIGSGPVFTGDLEQFCLPDLLELLRNTHRTGLLICTTEAGVGTIQLSRGMIIGADSPHAIELREHLLTNPELAPERRRALAGLPPEYFGDDMIEGVLASRDLVPRDQVERARVARIYSAFREMMGWTTGRFSFDPAVPIVTNPALALSAQSILMQIYQEQDEQGQ